MLYTILGKDGVGKTVFADIFAKQLLRENETVLIIDSELCQPTVPVMTNAKFSQENSLGEFIAITGKTDIQRFCKHPNTDAPGIYYAGCLPGDTITQYTGWETPSLKIAQANIFLETARESFDHIILMVKPSHEGVFFEPGLLLCDHLIVLSVPDIDGCFALDAMRPLLKRPKEIGIKAKIHYVADKACEYHDLKQFETLTECELECVLPFCDEINFKFVSRDLHSSYKTASGKRYLSLVKALAKTMRDEDGKE